MSETLVKEGGFEYVETNPGKECLLLLHGLFGDLSNFDGLIKGFSKDYNVVIPILPLYTLPLKSMTINGLMNFVNDFVVFKGIETSHVLGNSLGGHIAQLYALKHPEKVHSMILTGSSGLFENAFGSTFLKRGDYNFIKERVAKTFYDPLIATKEMVDEVFKSVNDRSRALRLLYAAKSAIRENLEDLIPNIKSPTLLIWGKQDEITPPFVAERFHELLENSEVFFIDKCGHAPMMEKPIEFNELLKAFLLKNPIGKHCV